MKKILVKIKANEGYTLVELLTVIILMMVIGLIITTIFVSSLRGGNKTTAMNDIRDNGNSAITRIARSVGYAKNFEGVSQTGEVDSYTSECVPDEVAVGTPTPTPPQYKYLKIRAFDEGETIYFCSDSKISSESASGTISLIDDAKIEATTCYFTCNQVYISQPPTIGINFTLTKGAESLFFEQKFSADFSTSVVMRNLGP